MLKRFDTKSSLFAIFLAFFVAVGLIFYNKAVIAQGNESYLLLIAASIKALASLKVLLVVFVLALLIYVFLTQGEKVSSFVFKHRFLLCILVLATLIGFGISGSSIGMWASYTGEEQSGLLAGVSRSIRSDEWLVSTPMALSQYADSTGEFQYFSNVVRGTSTDVFLEYGQPVFDIVEIFRPFHWGYLFLPEEQGLSFCWCGRLIALFIISFELGRLITNDKRHLSLIYACLITLAPAVQWWFATGGITEILIYSQLATVVFKQFLIANGNPIKRICCMAVICMCVGAYALVLYPPWQIPVAYVILALETWVFLTYKKNARLTLKEIVSCICCIAIFAILFARVLILSKDTIVTILNTTYPGVRVFHGGGNGLSLFNYFASIFFPIKTDGLPSNVCEASIFIDFFPLSLILPIYVLIANKSRDRLIIFLLIIVVFLDVYSILGYPPLVEKVTFLNKCQPERVLGIIGFPNVILLIRALSEFKFEKTKRLAILTLVFGFLGGVMVKLALPEYASFKLCILIMCIFSTLAFLLLNHNAQKTFCASALIALMLVAGGLVNPIQKGINCVFNSDVYKMVKVVHDADSSAKWASIDFPFGNFLITTGAPTVNSVNIYPNTERWSQIDKDESKKEIYNRYAHIICNLKQEGDAEFNLMQSDMFSVTMTPEDAKRIEIKYIFTTSDLSSLFPDEKVSLVKTSGNFKVYELH